MRSDLDHHRIIKSLEGGKMSDVQDPEVPAAEEDEAAGEEGDAAGEEVAPSGEQDQA